MTEMTEGLIRTGLITVVCISLGFLIVSALIDTDFIGTIKSLLSSKKEGGEGAAADNRLEPVEAAAYFAALRNHFAQTDQPGRVAVMDDDLAAGVFSTKDTPVTDVAAGGLDA